MVHEKKKKTKEKKKRKVRKPAGSEREKVDPACSAESQ